jgi:hypothetical protein
MDPNFDGLADPIDANTNVNERNSDMRTAAGTCQKVEYVLL